MNTILQKNCLVCGNRFYKPKTESLRFWKRHKYCCVECANNAPRSKETRLKQSLAKKGKPSWNKGKKLSEEHKAHLRGRRKPFKDTSKMGHPAWNKIGDGITTINEKIRKSKRYKNWRTMVYKRDDYRCVECKIRTKKGRKVKLQAHHIKPFSLYPKLRFELSNGITLCIDCHRKTDSYGINQWSNKNCGSKNTNAA